VYGHINATASNIDVERVAEIDGKDYLFTELKADFHNSINSSEVLAQSAIDEADVIDEITCDGEAIKFEKIDGRWIIVSVEDNYY
jgi:hypothetical protein